MENWQACKAENKAGLRELKIPIKCHVSTHRQINNNLI